MRFSLRSELAHGPSKVVELTFTTKRLKMFSNTPFDDQVLIPFDEATVKVG